MAVSIVVAVSSLSLILVEILRKNWLHQDWNILTSGNKRDHVIQGCLSPDWECFQARDEEPVYWMFGSGHTSCCWKCLSTVFFCTSKQRISSKGERVFFFPFCFPIAGLTILDWVKKMWTYLHAIAALILFRWWGSLLKAPCSAGAVSFLSQHTVMQGWC